MNTAATDRKPTDEPAPTAIPMHDRLVLWMFLLGVVAFGVVLIGDLLVGLFR